MHEEGHGPHNAGVAGSSPAPAIASVGAGRTWPVVQFRVQVAVEHAVGNRAGKTRARVVTGIVLLALVCAAAFALGVWAGWPTWPLDFGLGAP